MSIEFNKGTTLITKRPIKESEVSENRQYHRRMVREAMARKLLKNKK